MTMDRRTILKNLGVAGAVGALAGCASVQEDNSSDSSGDDTTDGSDGSDSSDESEESDPSGTGTVWYSLSEAEKERRESTIEEFVEETGYDVNNSDISDMQKKTTSAIPAGEGPHTFEWAHDWVGDYTQREFVVDQSDQVEVDLDQFTEAAADAVQFDGKLVGLPHDSETVALVYNTDIVDEAPETVSDMVSVMEEHHDPDNDQYGLGYPFNDPYFLSPWLQAFDGYLFDVEADDQLGVAKEETIRGAEFAVENFAPYMPNDPKYEPQASAFAEGNAAFAINGPWYLSTLNDNDINYEVAKLPTPEGGDPTPYTGITMWYFATGMEDGGDDAQAAREFIEWYVTNEDLMLQNAEDQGAIPVLTELVEGDDLPDSVQGFSAAVQQGVPMPSDPKMNEVWDPVKNALTKLFNGDAEPEPAMNQAAEEIRSNWD
ncbi:substrate-binding domain-containing protein [Halorussus salilacus]|uniref:substrate-binding domain-containing protein n=1 Tax=Halorussus salilacus TaxID=2953750 RepID=UPI0020A18506|nr:substrate-binding domain-containing protein [Halorussus salilacus]USZ67533.1 substrate-binding domain-containing protein [Halorussus salilacus]